MHTFSYSNRSRILLIATESKGIIRFRNGFNQAEDGFQHKAPSASMSSGKTHPPVSCPVMQCDAESFSASLYCGRTISNGSLVAVSTRSVMLPNIQVWTDPRP